ncbi:MAG: DUF169 domain-containing protein [Thermodesulfobacteriota bacterium]|nr:DUF169 domain-containing protein [Thermodesulfobacteriota bacterium]
MQSKISSAIRLKYCPVALLWSDKSPGKPIQFKKGRWGCVMWLIASAAKGKTSVCDRDTFGCFGGGVGLGFGNQYMNFPGGEEYFCHFLSSGNDQWETGRKTAEMVKPFLNDKTYEHFLHGERYLKTPDRVRKFIEYLPITDIPAKYVVFKSLGLVNYENETPQSIIFFANPDQLSALVVLANYGRWDNENVIIPYAAGCQTIGIYPYQEAKAEKQHAVVGLTDLSARVYIRKQLGNNLMTFTVPLAMFHEMEGNVEGSFLERSTWQNLLKMKE